MMTRDLCKESLALLHDWGFLRRYVQSGPLPPTTAGRSMRDDTRLLAHYARLEGALYQDLQQWEWAYAFVRSMTVAGSDRQRLVLADVFEPIPAELDTVLRDILPFICEQLGFTAHGQSEIAQQAWYVSADHCSVKELPEPYGKWLQHQEQRPRWDAQESLELRLHCTLRAETAHSTRMGLTLSAPVLPVVRYLAEGIGHVLHKTIRLNPAAGQTMLALGTPRTGAGSPQRIPPFDRWHGRRR